LYGIEAINANNGWSIAVIGAGIVFAGLVVLSIAISQFHKLLLFWDKRNEFFKLNGRKIEEQSDITSPEHFPLDIYEVAEIYKPVFAKLGDSFQLADLYAIARKYNFPHPHLTIKGFRQAGIMLPLGDGCFKLNTELTQNQG
jgi:hypothetical protein